MEGNEEYINAYVRAQRRGECGGGKKGDKRDITERVKFVK